MPIRQGGSALKNASTWLRRSGFSHSRLTLSKKD
jgi:hypothetical protein